MNAAAAVTLVGLVALLFVEWRRSLVGKAVIKPLTSAGFITTAVLAGAADSPYGRWVLVALALSWVGDVCLIGRARAAFLAGLVAFLLGHVAFAVAFVVRGLDSAWALGAAVPMAAVALFVERWLRPQVPDGLRRPVVAYITVITAMVVLSVGTWATSPAPLIPLAATLFWASDISVARDRFTGAGFGNRLWGLSAYYVAQLLFAFSVIAP